ncbi:hypothetical protein ILUMI_04708, partial [Ignelater luminosus]
CFCAVNELVITNTFFPHKIIHQITRKKPSRRESSIIDYVILSKRHGSKYRPLPIKNKDSTTRWDDDKEIKKQEYQRVVEEKFNNEDRIKDNAQENLEQVWNVFRSCILDSVELVCERSKVGGKKAKRSGWWTEKVKGCAGEAKEA